jgi:ferrous iron transport protein B
VQSTPTKREAVLSDVQSLRWEIGRDFHDRLMENIYADAARIAGRAVTRPGAAEAPTLGRTIDRIVTSRIWGFPLMILLFAVVFWITISGANVPSGFLASIFLERGHPWLLEIAARIGMPWWLSGILIDGCYLATAWVVSVMLPPMAIFFPLFTLLEDLGYLPRVAFNLDRSFQRVGAHGKQALTMMMGFGCNAAGVVAARVIDSPRERLIAIITNNFALCNGRWPTQIMIATLFLGSLVPAYLGGLISALAVVGVALLGVSLSFGVSWLLSRTVLRGEVSSFSLELPPYRPPRILQTLYTSVIDRTFFVLWRAIVFAMPAGAVIWTISNVTIGDVSLAGYAIGALDLLGFVLGLNGVILLAYVVAIPANEIVIPTILMLTVLTTGISGIGAGTGVMFELDSLDDTMQILQAGGWTVLTALNVMLFSLIHNPCSTTIYTIYKETGSIRWTAFSTLLPLGMGVLVLFFTTQVWRMAAGL